MLDGYHRIFNRFALKQVDRGIDIPDVHLGVGLAENLAPTPLVVSYESGFYTPAQIPTLKTLEQVSIDGQGRAVSLEDFPSTGWIGDQLGGF